MSLFTIGHSNRTWEHFVEILHAHNINAVIDVRGGRATSRTFPHFDTFAVDRALKKISIYYERVATLGGRRSRSKTVPDNVNGAFRVEAFQNYADYAYASDEFDAGIQRLLELDKLGNVAYMCSEAVPWRCHRSIVTDYLMLVHKMPIIDILGKTQKLIAKPHGFAKVEHNKVIYPTIDYQGN